MSKSLQEMLSTHDWVGVVEDNQDPKFRGRVRVRISFIHENVPTKDLPWVSPRISTDGKSFKVPDIGKVVNIHFLTDDLFSGEYISAEHHDINLQNYLETLSSDDYGNFAAVQFDAYVQIYAQKSKGLMLDYMKSNINLTQEGDINLNLRDNQSLLNLGSPDASQQAILGNAWMNLMDDLMTMLPNAYLGNLGAPVIPTPALLDWIAQYQDQRSTFLSKNVRIVDNDEVLEQNRACTPQAGDNYVVNASSSDVTFYTQNQTKSTQKTDSEQADVYTPVPRAEPESRSSSEDESQRNVVQKPISAPKTFIAASKSSTLSGLNITDLILDDDHYHKESTPKTSIWLHHTAGFGNAEYVISDWNTRPGSKVAVAYVIGGVERTTASMDGAIWRCFDDTYWAPHLGLKSAQLRKVPNPARLVDIHKNSIGIEICNLGPLTVRNGNYYSYLNTIVPANEVVTLSTPFRGHLYYHAYTTAQIASLKKLMIYLMHKYNITSNKVWTPTSFEWNADAFYNSPGIWSHGNVRTDKTDVCPQIALINMLNSIS